jgi:hypothetical protein
MRIGDRLASIAWAEARTIGVSAREYNIDNVTWLANLLSAEHLARRCQGVTDIEFLQIAITGTNDYCIGFSRYLGAGVCSSSHSDLCLSLFKPQRVGGKPKSAQLNPKISRLLTVVSVKSTSERLSPSESEGLFDLY